MKKLLIQGDVALRLVPRPADMKSAPDGAEVLALGETSGHGHVLESCDVLIGAEETKYVLPKKEAKLLHKHLISGGPADHRALDIPEVDETCIYKVVLQNEHDPYEKAMRKVTD